MRRVVPKEFPSDPVLHTGSELGAYIRAARTQSGMTLEYAALAVGIAKQTMQDIETHPETVAFGTVLMVARELGVSLLAVPSERVGPTRRLIEQARGVGTQTA